MSYLRTLIEQTKYKIKFLEEKKESEGRLSIFDKLELEYYQKVLKELEISDSTGYEADDVFMAITNKNTIKFCGDAYYGEFSKDSWLRFIKECIDAYKKLN